MTVFIALPRYIGTCLPSLLIPSLTSIAHSLFFHIDNTNSIPPDSYFVSFPGLGSNIVITPLRPNISLSEPKVTYKNKSWGIISTSDFQSEVGEVFGEIGGELPAKFGGRFSSFFCWEYRQKHIPPKLHRKFHHQTSLRGSGLRRALELILFGDCNYINSFSGQLISRLRNQHPGSVDLPCMWRSSSKSQ